MDSDLNAPLDEGEALNVRQWVETKIDRGQNWYVFEGKTPEYVALMLRMDGYTAVRDRDVLKAAGRL